jgi:hypothetical protein
MRSFHRAFHCCRGLPPVLPHAWASGQALAAAVWVCPPPVRVHGIGARRLYSAESGMTGDSGTPGAASDSLDVVLVHASSDEVRPPSTFYEFCERGDLSRVREFITQKVDVNTPDRVRFERRPRAFPACRWHVNSLLRHGVPGDPPRQSSVVEQRHLAWRHAADIWRSCRCWWHTERT